MGTEPSEDTLDSRYLFSSIFTASWLSLGKTLFFAYDTYFLIKSLSIAGTNSISNSGIVESWYSSPSIFSLSMCDAKSLSLSLSGVSTNLKIMSNLDSRGGGKSICSAIVFIGSYLPNLGFAAANIEHLEFNVAIIPAFAMVTVCCSIASCIADVSL